MHSHGTHVHDARIVDEHGQHLLTVGADGFDAGISSVLDPDTPFAESDASLFGQLSSESLNDTMKSGGFNGDDSLSNSGWLDSFGFGGDSNTGEAGGGDAGGGYSSCGGDCGGGGGE